MTLSFTPTDIYWPESGKLASDVSGLDNFDHLTVSVDPDAVESFVRRGDHVTIRMANGDVYMAEWEDFADIPNAHNIHELIGTR